MLIEGTFWLYDCYSLFGFLGISSLIVNADERHEKKMKLRKKKRDKQDIMVLQGTSM